VDGLLVIYTPQDFAGAEELAAALIAQAAAATTDKPLLTAWMGGREVQRGRELMVEQGIPAYETAEAAVRTYIYMTQYERNSNSSTNAGRAPVDEAPPKNHLMTLVRRSCRETRFILTEEDSWKFLRNYGIPVIPSGPPSPSRRPSPTPRYRLPRGPEGLFPDIIFRQDVGGVITGIDSDEALKVAYQRILDGVRQFAPQAAVRGVTVQKMIGHIDYELILGVKKDALRRRHPLRHGGAWGGAV